MEKFMTLLQEKLTPIANFCGTERHFASMQKGFMSAISFILVSAVFMILANPPVTADLVAQGAAGNWRAAADAIMTTGSARGPGNEANYVMQKFARAVIGTNNVDCCARVCHGPSVAGLQATLGNGAMSNSIGDIENSKCLLVIGYNCADSHPIVARRIIKAKNKGAKLIVCDPRHIETARIADGLVDIIDLGAVEAF